MGGSRFMSRLVAGVFAALLLACCSTRADADASASPGAAAQLAPEPEPGVIEVWNRPLITLHAPYNSMTAAERAAGAQHRIADAIDRIDPDSLNSTWVESADAKGALIGSNAGILFGITPADVEGGRDEVERAGQEVVSRLRAILAERSEAEHPQAILRGVAYALLGTLAILLLGWAVMYGMRRIDRRLEQIIAALPVHTHVHGFEMRPVLWNGLRRVVALLRLFLLLALAYVWLGFVLRRFAYTRPWGDALAGYLVDAGQRLGDGFVQSIPALITLLLIWLVTRAVARIAGAWFRGVESGRIEVDWLDPPAAGATRRIVTIGIWLFALTIAYPYIPGSGTEAFKGISVFVGLMLSLGSAGIVNQVVSGLVVLYSRAIRVGDFVKVDEHQGTVRELGFLSLRLVTRKHEEIIVPNSVLAGTAVENYTRQLRERGALLVTTSVTIGYDTPWRQVHALLELAATRTTGISADPKPFVLQAALTTYAIEYQLNVAIADPRQKPFVLSELHQNILDLFNEFGVQIMVPAFEGQPEDKIWVPREKWNQAPARADASGEPEVGSG
jgi:small-conductance mechanosensitive channel